MITLPGSILAAGMFSADPVGEGYTLLKPQTSFCQSGYFPLPGALPNILREIEAICCPETSTADTPNAAAYQAVRKILEDADNLSVIAAPVTSVEDFEGALELHWDAPYRSIVLGCSGKTSEVTIYRESRTAEVVDSSLIRNATAGQLSDNLQWVLQ